MDYDVAVVGAGPAGSATARSIAQAGFKVLIVEKRLAIGQPSFCSGLVSPRTLEEAGVSNEIVLNEIKGASIHSASGRHLKLNGDKTHAFVINRAGLDEKLAEQAQEAGADLRLDAKLVGIARENHHLRLAVSRNGKVNEVTARIVVGADGVGSLVGRWVGIPDRDDVVRAVAAEGWMDGVEPDKAAVFVGNRVAPGWFGWIIPLGDGRVRIGTGNGNHHRIPAKQLLSNMMTQFPAQFQGVKLDRVWAKAIPLYSPVKTYGDNVLLVGDAARQVKPTSGGGIYTGLVGARHCAGAAVDALRKDDFSEAVLAQYEAGWKGELRAELERGIDLRRAFTSLNDAEIDELLDIFNMPLLQKTISRLGDIDFPSSVMEQLVRVAPVLRLFLRVPLRFPYRWAADLVAAFRRKGGGE